MEREELEAIVREEVFSFADVHGLNANFYFLENREQHIYAVGAITHERQNRGYLPILVRIEDDKVFIECDNNMTPLHLELYQRGVPENQVVLAYPA